MRPRVVHRNWSVKLLYSALSEPEGGVLVPQNLYIFPNSWGAKEPLLSESETKVLQNTSSFSLAVSPYISPMLIAKPSQASHPLPSRSEPVGSQKPCLSTTAAILLNTCLAKLIVLLSILAHVTPSYPAAALNLRIYIPKISFRDSSAFTMRHPRWPVIWPIMQIQRKLFAIPERTRKNIEVAVLSRRRNEQNRGTHLTSTSRNLL